ncbi:MAG: CoA ester lyase [Azospirillaceae bacterium]
MDVIRSWLIAPANKREMVSRFPERAADCVVIDLEDGTPDAEKEAARAALEAQVAELRSHGLRASLYVRVNAPASPHHSLDVEAACNTAIDGIVIPKLSRCEELRATAHHLTRSERKQDRTFKIIGGIETALGVLNVTEIAFADSHLVALYFGAEDFASDVGGMRRTPGSLEVHYARSRVALAAKAARLLAIDQGVLEIRDDQRFTEDANMARDLGYDGKVCVHPRQAELANEVFRPTHDEVDRSRRLLQACAKAERDGVGVIDFEGLMVDGPLIRRAEAIVAMVERVESN